MSMIVKCLACGAQNRIKDDPTTNPVCGKCKTPLLFQTAMPIHLTDITFDNYIRKSHKPVLVDFWAGWCAPCRLLAPVLDAFAKTQLSIIVAKIDTERNPLITSKFKVFSIPTLILFDKGEEAKRITGALSLQALEHQFKQWITVN
jgi:thioredoxin 2